MLKETNWQKQASVLEEQRKVQEVELDHLRTALQVCGCECCGSVRTLRYLSVRGCSVCVVRVLLCLYVLHQGVV